MKKISLVSIFILGLLCVTMTLPAFSAGVELNAVTSSTVPDAGNTTAAMSSPSEATSLSVAETAAEAQIVSAVYLNDGTKLKIDGVEYPSVGRLMEITYDNGMTETRESISFNELAEYDPSLNEQGLLSSEDFSGIEDYYSELTGDSVMSALSEAGFIAETEIDGESVWQIQDSFRELESSGDFDLELNMDDAEDEAQARESIFTALKEADVPYISRLTESFPEGAEEEYGFFITVETSWTDEEAPGLEYVVKYDKEPGSTEIEISGEMHFYPDYQSTTTNSDGEQITTTITPESFDGKEEIVASMGTYNSETEDFETISYPEGVEFVDTYDSGSYVKYTIDSDGNENLTEMGYLKGATIEEDGITYTFDEEVKTVKLEISSTGILMDLEFDKEVSLTGSDGSTGIFTKTGIFSSYQETSSEAGEEIDLSDLSLFL